MLESAATEYTIDDYRSMVGREQAVTCAMFDVASVRAFERATGLGHVERAADANSFPGTIVPGFYTLSLIDALISSVTKPTPDCYLVNYGLERVRFVSPIHFDDATQFQFRIETVTERSSGPLIDYSCRFVSADLAQVLMVGHWLALIKAR